MNKFAFIGPTNSGKTHDAMQIVLSAKSAVVGTYLRIGAFELYKKACEVLGEDKCAYKSGEDGEIYTGWTKPTHWFCTYECCPKGNFDTVMIDEYHALYTDGGLAGRRAQAILSLEKRANKAQTAIICGALSIELLLKQKKYKITKKKRMSPFPERVDVDCVEDIADQTAIVVASTREVNFLAQKIANAKGGAVGVVYGAMSTPMKHEVATLFNSGELVAIICTSAVSYGVNLDIDHVLFAGVKNENWRDQDIYQMASRAGRGVNMGKVGVLHGAEGDTDGCYLVDFEIDQIEEALHASIRQKQFTEDDLGEAVDFDAYEAKASTCSGNIDDYIIHPTTII